MATIVLLLLPLIPIAVANQPNWNVEFRIRPGATTYYGPCVVSTNFPVDVYLWNDKSLTGVGVYAYDFKVKWQNTAGISLDSFANHIPWPSGKYFLVVNETGTSGGFDYYHVAVTAVGNSTLDPSLELGATGVFNASIVTLTFHIDKEPCWPDNFHADFTIYDVVASGGCGANITNLEIDNGKYDLYSSQPDIHLFSTENSFPDNITEKRIGNTHVVEVHLSNITYAFGFGVNVTWDPGFLGTDVQKITLCTSFPPPYEWLVEEVDVGSLYVELWRPCEKPTVCSQDTCVLSITFISNSTQLGQVPSDWDTSIDIEYAWVASKCPDIRFYDYPFGDLLYAGDLPYLWRPNRADLNLDGVVNVQDLSALAKVYSTSHKWSDLASPVFPANVDIFDLVYVAKRYGEDP